MLGGMLSPLKVRSPAFRSACCIDICLMPVLRPCPPKRAVACWAGPGSEAVRYSAQSSSLEPGWNSVGPVCSSHFSSQMKALQCHFTSARNQDLFAYLPPAMKLSCLKHFQAFFFPLTMQVLNGFPSILHLFN